MTQERWSKQNEEALVALQERRKRFRDRVESQLESVAQTVYVDFFASDIIVSDMEPGARIKHLAQVLERHADRLIDSLVPFDSGTRPADDDDADA